MGACRKNIVGRTLIGCDPWIPAGVRGFKPIVALGLILPAHIN